MTRWIDGRPGWWWGWSDLGPIQIPPLPPFLLLTDRVTGQVWWVQPDATFTHVQITTASPPAGQTQILYQAFNEPYISGTPGIAQLFVSNGTLNVGMVIPNVQGITNISTDPIYARAAPAGSSFATTVLKIILVSSGPGNAVTFGFTPLVYNPTPNPVCPPPCT